MAHNAPRQLLCISVSMVVVVMAGIDVWEWHRWFVTSHCWPVRQPDAVLVQLVGHMSTVLQY